jgi:hypothetical protein
MCADPSFVRQFMREAVLFMRVQENHDQRIAFRRLELQRQTQGVADMIEAARFKRVERICTITWGILLIPCYIVLLPAVFVFIYSIAVAPLALIQSPDALGVWGKYVVGRFNTLGCEFLGSSVKSNWWLIQFWIDLVYWIFYIVIDKC